MTSNTLSGSERKPMHEAAASGRADPNERLEVSMVLRRTNADALTARIQANALQKPVGPHLTREEFERKFGASDADIAAVKKFAHSYGLAVVQEHAGRRTIVLSGTVSKFNEAFGVNLQEFHYPGGSYRGRVGALHLPKELQDKVEAVLGLDNRPAAQPHFRASRRADAGRGPGRVLHAAAGRVAL
jgi:kumamolisin